MKTIKTTNRISKLSKTLFALAVVAISLSSCKKDEQITPNPEPVPEKVATLTSGNWVLESAIINGNNVMETYLDDCEKDDITIFKKDGTYITDVGAEKCDPNEKQTKEGKWKFTENYTKLVTDEEFVNNVTLLTKEELHTADTTYEDGIVYVQQLKFVSK